MALAPLYNTGFEHGRLAVEGGAPFSLVGGDATTRDIVTTPVRNGTYSLKCAPTAALQGRAETPAWTASSKIQIRMAVYINTAPTAVARFITPIIAAGGDPKIEIDGTNFIASIIDSGRVTGAAFTVGQWHLIEMQIDTAATSVTTLDWWVDGVAQTQVTRAQADSTISKMRLGSASGTGPAYEAYFDDIAVATWSATSDRFDDGKGIALSPNADLGAGGGSAASFTVTGAATFWEATDDIPLSSTSDYVAQTGGTNADWYKIGLQDTTESAVNAVQALMQYNSSGTAANSAATYVARSDGTQQTTIFFGDMSESSTSLFYKSAQVIAPSGGWTPAAANDLQFWIGFGSDISPNPRWHALLLELDVPAAAGPVTKSASDSLSVGVTDALVTQLIRSTATDTLTVGTTDARLSQVIRDTVEDTLTVGVTDSRLSQLIRATATDSLTVGVTDALSAQVIRSSSTDSLTVSVTDTGSVVVVGGGVVAVTASDTLALSIADAVGGQVARSSAADTLTVGITDALSKQLARTTATDSLTLGLTEALASQRIRSTATDSLAVAVVEARSLRAFLTAADTLGLSVIEVAQVRVAGPPTELRVVLISQEFTEVSTAEQPPADVTTTEAPTSVSTRQPGVTITSEEA